MTTAGAPGLVIAVKSRPRPGALGAINVRADRAAESAPLQCCRRRLMLGLERGKPLDVRADAAILKSA